MTTEEFLHAIQRLVGFTCAGIGVNKSQADDDRLDGRWAGVLNVLADGPDAFLNGVLDAALKVSDAVANADGTPVIVVSINKGLLEAATDDDLDEDWVADLDKPDRWEMITSVPTRLLGASARELASGMRDYFETKLGRRDRRPPGGYL
jgi:hypothetical protein